MSHNQLTTLSSSSTAVASNEPLSERRELDLSQVEDLDTFLESIEDVYGAAICFDDPVDTRSSLRLSVEEASRKLVFEKLRQKRRQLVNLVGRCRHDVIIDEEEITDSEVEKMQLLYDEMLELRNKICSVPLTESIPTAIIDTREESSVTQSRYVGEENITDVTKQTNTVTDSVEIPDGGEVMLDAAERQVESLVVKISSINERVNSEFSIVEKTDSVAGNLNELAICLTRIKDLRTRLQECRLRTDDVAVLRNSIAKYLRVATEIDKNALAIEAVLLSGLQSGNPVEPEPVPRSVERIAVKTPTQPTKESVMVHRKTICGLPIPIPGPAGVPLVRDMREKLMIARDNHSELRFNPGKQILVDKLVRILSQVKREGLSEQVDIPVITDLVKNINVPYADTTSDSLSPYVTSAPKAIQKSSAMQDDVHSSFQKQKRKTMSIVDDSFDGNITIDVDKKTKKRFTAQQTRHHLKEQPLKTNKGQSVSEQIPEGDTGVVAAVEQRDPINVAVPDTRPVMSEVNPVHADISLTAMYLTSNRYCSFIETYYTSSSAFERLLDAEITQIESSAVDALSRWLGEKNQSPFAFLKDQSVRDILELAAHKEVRTILGNEDIKYETFLVWVDLIGEMQVLVNQNLYMTLGELFARWIIESQIQYSESS